MQCQTRSLRLATTLRLKVLNKQFISTSIKSKVLNGSYRLCSSAATQQQPIKLRESPAINATLALPTITVANNNNNKSYTYDYEIRLGPVTENISTQTMLQLQQQCGDCLITKTRNDKALYIQTNNNDNISRFQSLIYSEFLQHKTTIDAGDKTRFVGGRNYANIHKLQDKTQAFIHLNFYSGQISIYGTVKAVEKAKKLLMSYLNKIIFIELDNKISWVCARNHVWINQMKTSYDCEIYSEPTGRLVIIAETHICKLIIRSIQNRLDTAPSDNDIKNKKVHQYKLASKVQNIDNIADVIRVVRNNHNFINVNNIHSIFAKLAALRESQMEHEDVMLAINEFTKFKNVSGEQQLCDAMTVRRKKNSDYMFFMSKFAKKHLEEINDIRSVALFIWSFAIFGIKQFGDGNVKGKEDKTWQLFINRFLSLYKYSDPKAHDQKGVNLNTRHRNLHSMVKVLSAFSVIHPVQYNEYKSHLSFILSEIHSNISVLGGSSISYALNAMANDDNFMRLCRNASFLTNKDDNIWIFLSNANNYKSIHDIGHINVKLILNSLCFLYPSFHNEYINIVNNEYIIATVLNLCNELFFYHQSLEIQHSISIITHLTYLGFYEEILFNFLLPMDKINKIDSSDANIYHKSSVHKLLYSFGKTLHVSQPQIIKKLTKQLVEYRSTFAFEQYIECIWSILSLHFIAENQENAFNFVSKQSMNELFKTLGGKLSDCEVSFMSNDIVIKLLQINIVSNIMQTQTVSMQVMQPSFLTMLKNGLQSELVKQYNYNTENEADGWDRNKYNILLLKCINNVLYGNEIGSESFLMKNKYELQPGTMGGIRNKTMQFDHVDSNGLIVNFCIDDKKKRGIMIFGPNDVFVDNNEKLCGENYINYHVLTKYFDWNLLCLNWKTHATQQDITYVVQQWFDQQNKHISVKTALP